MYSEVYHNVKKGGDNNRFIWMLYCDVLSHFNVFNYEGNYGFTIMRFYCKSKGKIGYQCSFLLIGA